MDKDNDITEYEDMNEDLYNTTEYEEEMNKGLYEDLYVTEYEDMNDTTEYDEDMNEDTEDVTDYEDMNEDLYEYLEGSASVFEEFRTYMKEIIKRNQIRSD